MHGVRLNGIFMVCSPVLVVLSGLVPAREAKIRQATGLFTFANALAGPGPSRIAWQRSIRD